jgi:NhaP-type Na+/H+ or K+/H+ antiporter
VGVVVLSEVDRCLAVYVLHRGEMSALSIEIPLLVVLCILYTFASYAIHEYKTIHQVPPWCHESSIATILGILIGAILKFFWNQIIIFDNEIFFYFVLPPIIFSAGYTLKRRNFFRYFHLISLFGILGTILQFLSIALLSSLFAYYFLNPMTSEDQIFTWKDGILLSAILSGSDEVSAMSLVRMKDFPRMGALIFGEGVLNDALSIVLFKVLSEWIAKTSGDPSSSLTDTNKSSVGISGVFILSLFETVLLEIFLSCLIGLCCGLVHARLLILLPTLRSHPVHQTTLIILFGYISYALAELSGHASSILTLFVAAVTLAHYSYYSLSKTAQLTTQIAFKSFAEISEAFSFSYLGLSVFSLNFTHYRILYSLSLLISLIFVRLVTILFLFAILRTGIPLREQIGFSLGGMVRGSLCWAQVQYIQNTAHPVLITTILVVVMSTTVGSGMILPIVMPWLTEGLGVGKQTEGKKIKKVANLKDDQDKEESLSLTQWTLENQFRDPSQLLLSEERDEDEESTYTTHLNNSVEDSLSVGLYHVPFSALC